LGKPRHGEARFLGNDHGDQRTIGRHGLVDALALDLKCLIPVKVVVILAAGGGRD
jgi:hypothetical protein